MILVLELLLMILALAKSLPLLRKCRVIRRLQATSLALVNSVLARPVKDTAYRLQACRRPALSCRMILEHNSQAKAGNPKINSLLMQAMLSLRTLDRYLMVELASKLLT